MAHESGVYMIRDTVSGRRYIGSAVRLWNRRRQHFQSLARGDHHSRFMQKTWIKRPDALEFSIVLYCDRENLLMYEQILLDAYKPEFNTATIAGSQLGLKMSDESRAKMSKSRRKDFSSMTGKTHSDEAKAKMSMNRKGKGGDKGWTQERKDKISAALKGVKLSPSHCVSIGKSKAALTDDQVREVRSRLSQGEKQNPIASSYGVNRSVISEIKNGNSYRWVD